MLQAARFESTMQANYVAGNYNSFRLTTLFSQCFNSLEI